MKLIFQAMDIFYFPINFHYKDHKVFHSIFGYVFSILLYFVIIFFFSYFAQDFFNKTNPIVLFKENEFNEDFSVSLGDLLKNFSYNFYFNESSAYLNDSLRGGQNIVNPILYINFVLINNDINNFHSVILNEPVNITFKEKERLYYFESNFELNNDKQILYYDYNSTLGYWDLKISDYKNKSLKDIDLSIEKNSFIYLVIRFNDPYDKDFLKGCLEIKDFHIRYNISDYILNVDERDFFKEYSLYEFINIPSFKLINQPYITYYYNYALIHIEDDDGFILSEKENKYNLKKSFSTPTMTVALQQFLILFEIRMDKVKKTYERKYKKLQNVFADIGGLINSLIIIGNLIIYGFNNNKFYYELINNIHGKDENKDKINKYKNKIHHQISSLKINDIFFKNEHLQMNGSNQSSSRSINFMNKSKMTISDKYLRKFQNKGSGKIKNSNIYSNKSLIKEIEFLGITKIPDNSYCSKENYKKFPCEMNKEKILFQLEKNENNFEKKDKINEFIKVCNKKQRIIYFTPFEFIKSILCCSYMKTKDFIEKEKTFYKLTKKLYDCLDIVNYCQVFANFEKFKLILLNENQNFSFNFIETGKIEFFPNDKTKTNLDKVYKYFNRNRKDFDKIDKKLYDNFSSNFIDFLN